jgi:hypothetical protein
LFSLSAYGIEIKIAEDYKRLKVKRSVKVVVSEKVTTEDLSKLAVKIKNSDPIPYQRTFIGYLLKGQEDEGFWATTSFSPDLEVKILGVSVEDDNASKQLKIDNAVGAWLDPGNVIHAIYYKNKELYLGYKSASSEKDVGKRTINSPDEEMVVKKVKQGLRVDDKNGNDFGDFYIINKNGDLEVWSEKKGKYRTLKKLNLRYIE